MNAGSEEIWKTEKEKPADKKREIRVKWGEGRCK